MSHQAMTTAQEAETILVINKLIRKSMESDETRENFKGMVNSIFKEEIDSRFTSLEARIAALENSLSEQQIKVASQQATISAQQTQLTTQSVTSKQQFNMNQSGKLNNLVVSGLPETENEDPSNLIKLMAEATATKLGEFTAARIGKSKQDKSRLILVSCKSHWDKRNLYAARTSLKASGYQDTFINEDLSQKQGELFFHARKAKVQKLFYTTWTENGTVYVKVEPNTKASVISSIEELKRLAPTYTVPT